MAWRESRGSRGRLALFISSIVLGVAALVAIQSFGDSLRRAVDDQARALLGADLSLESNRPFSAEAEAIIDSLGGIQSRRVSFSSMALFPRNDGTRLVTVRADSGGFPFYGNLVTDPPEAAETYRTAVGALIDGSLATQFDAQVGDTVKIGESAYQIQGILKKTSRESAAFSLVSPRVYIPLTRIDSTLIGAGSRVGFEVFFLFDESVDVEALLGGLKPRLRRMGLRSDSVEEVRQDWNEVLANLYKFLGLSALMALLLGSVGVASAIHVFVNQRLQTVAILRVYGARIGATFRVYLFQALMLGVLGSVAGAALGIGIQQLLPQVLADFLPVDVDFVISWSAAFLGIGIGTLVTVMFALLPLLKVRKVSPMMALRSAAGLDELRRLDTLKLVVLAGLVITVAGVAIVQGPQPVVSIVYVLVAAAVCGLLAGFAYVIMRVIRKITPPSLPYVTRQGLANLYRPNNQTLMMMLAVGLGTFLVAMFVSVESILLNQIETADERGRPNLVFFDIQPDQIDGVVSTLEARGLPLVESVPIVTMRLAEINGRTVDEMRADSSYHVTWAHRREYRSTYRSRMTESEELVDGEFAQGRYSVADLVPISIEEDIMQDLRVQMGDTLVFDVQGLPVRTRISSVRRVDWRQVRTNFFVVFPEGVLEAAPQFNVVVTRAETEAESGGAQAAVIRSFPNVSAIDLSLILRVAESVFDRIAFVVRFMAIFSILTGLIVLAAAVVVSRIRRIEESVLLKTLGAARRQVFTIMTVEYSLLGLLAAATGVLLSFIASWALAQFVFEARLALPYGSLAILIVTVTVLTISVGLVTSRGVYSRSPLEVLRLEV